MLGSTRCGRRDGRTPPMSNGFTLPRASSRAMGYEATHIALVVAVDLDKRFVWIKWLGTHRDYDAWTVSVPYGKWKHPGLREERLVGDGDDGFGEALHQPPKNGEQHWVAPMD